MGWKDFFSFLNPSLFKIPHIGWMLKIIVHAKNTLLNFTFHVYKGTSCPLISMPGHRLMSHQLSSAHSGHNVQSMPRKAVVEAGMGVHIPCS